MTVPTGGAFPASHSFSASFRDARILVIDDVQANVMLLERVLEWAGADPALIRGITDPLVACAVYQEMSPDLVLLDLHMGGLDGVEVMAALTEIRAPDDFVPIIVLTADITSTTRRRALAAGATDFLTKPFDNAEVALRAGNLLHARSLHRRIEQHNAALRAEIDLRDVAVARARSEHEAKLARIRLALSGEALRAVFQPIEDLGSRAVVAYEALSRFDCEPRRPPDVWFAEGAEVGNGPQLELQAVACALSAIPALPTDALLTLNVSPDAAVTDEMVDILAGHECGRLVVEITEHTAISDYDKLVAGLGPIRRLGVRVAVDDAGAGFASFRHILRLGPEIIKLDTALVRDVDTDPVKRAMASALVTFAQEMDSTIVAEGIETEAELRTLTDLGVPWGQGYLLGHPGALVDAG